MLEAVLEEYIESTILEHCELVQACRATEEQRPTIHRRNALASWDAVKDTLVLLAFSPDAADHWQLIGIPRGEGAMPTEDLIERRVRLGGRFASLRSDAKWSHLDVARATEFVKQFKKARQACIGDLPRVQREKKQWQNRLVPRWMEPSVELYQFLYERAQSNPNHRLALRLSNIQGANLHGLDYTLPVQEARLIYEKVLRSAAPCEVFPDAWRCQHYNVGVDRHRYHITALVRFQKNRTPPRCRRHGAPSSTAQPLSRLRNARANA